MRTLDHTRVTIAAQAVGHRRRRARGGSQRYVREHRQFGRAVAEFQGIQFMIAEMAHEAGGRPAADLRRRRPVGAG